MTSFRLRDLPISARLMLTAFLAITGAGYLFGLANIYTYHRSADGQEGFSTNDLKAVYTGVQSSATEPPRVRMIEMIDTSMRKYLPTENEYQALRQWLTGGAVAEAFTRQLPPADKSPHDILSDQCLRCHNPEGEQGQEKAHQSPFGPDLFTVDLAMVNRYAHVDPARTSARKHGPQSSHRLILVSHIHMLSIPVFTLITSMLMLLTGVRPSIRGPLVCLPMLLLVFDFTGWWVARWVPWTIWMIAASGPIYSVTFGSQLFAVFGSMWFGRRSDA